MLIDSFMKYKGWSGNHKGGNYPLVPYILADALSIAHDTYLKGRLKFEAKRHANKMMKCYDHLNKDFFRAFSFEEGLLITDRMNKFDDYLHNDFEIFRMAVIKPLMNYPQEVREIISGLCLCKLLATQIVYLYNLMYRDQYGRPLVDRNIQGIKHHAYEMFSAFKSTRKADYIDLNDIPAVQTSLENIITHTREFIDSWKDEEEQD